MVNAVGMDLPQCDQRDIGVHPGVRAKRQLRHKTAPIFFYIGE